MVLPAAAMLFAGCQKQMDMQLDDRVDNMEDVFNRLSRAYDHLRSVYYVPVITGPQSGFSAGGYMMAGYCDEAQEVNQLSVVYDWYNGRVSSVDMPLWYEAAGGSERWAGLFNCIDGCNVALKWLTDDNLVTDYEETQRQGLVSQFYGLRAYCYLQLIKRWGGVPIIDEPIGKDHDYSNDKRASFAACVDFIIESCDAAMAYTDNLTAEGLPWFASGSQNWQLIRLGRAALWSIKSQAALYAASPLWSEDYEGARQKYTWETAAGICKEALDQAMGHGAKLVDKNTAFPAETAFGLTPYDKYFLASYQPSSWDTETIYQPYNYSYYKSTVWQYAGPPLDSGQVSAGACPSQEMVDAYDVVSADGTTAVPLLDLASPYDVDGTPNFNPDAIALGYMDGSETMYENRDPRFYATIYYDGVEVTLANGSEYEIQTYAGGNCGLNASPSNTRNTCTGYYLRKFSNAQSGAEAGNNDGYIRGFRLAELYLNFAEAAYHAYGEDYPMPATTAVEKDNNGVPQTVVLGEPMSARQAIDAVRARVGMPGITETGDGFRLRLHNERRVELAFEEHRFFDVRRWTAPSGDLSGTDKKVSGMRIEKQNGGKTYTRVYYGRQCYTNKYLKYPVALDEVRKMMSLTGGNWQNGGWD